MINEVDYGISPVFMDKHELKKEIWRLKGIIDRLETENQQLRKHQSTVTKIVINQEWSTIKAPLSK